MNSLFYEKEQNKVPFFLRFVWLNEMTHADQYTLWFEKFNALERVKLWNSLCFSENYYNYVAHTASYLREDILLCLKDIDDKRKAEEAEISK